MVVRHLVSGVALGLLAAAASLLLGFSTEAALGLYVLGGSVGLALSVAGQLARARPANSRATLGGGWITPAG